MEKCADLKFCIAKVLYSIIILILRKSMHWTNPETLLPVLEEIKEACKVLQAVRNAAWW